MKTFLECWAGVAGELFAQALAGEPEFTEAPPQPFNGASLGFEATLSGDEEGRFTVVLDGSVLDSPMMGEGADQKAGWTELLQETINAAVGELQAKTGKKCSLTRFEPSIDAIDESDISRSFQLRSGDRAWTILIEDRLRPSTKTEAAAKSPKGAAAQSAASGGGQAAGQATRPGQDNGSTAGQRQAAAPNAAGQASGQNPGQGAVLTPGLDLLLDVELEATLRFGSREMLLGDVLELGPGDVVQLDRYITDTVDLLVGDKIVARGDVVLVNGNFGLRVTEVAQPKKRLETIRCLF